MTRIAHNDRMSPRSRVLLFLVSTPIAALLILGGLLGAARPVPQQGLPHLRVFEDVAEVATIDANTPLPPGDVGIVLSRQFYLRIVGVRDGSPAQRAGLQSGDYIRAINDTPTRDMSAFAGTRLLRGPVGSTVSVMVIRGNPADPHKIDLVRESTSGDAITVRQMGEQRYVRITSIGQDTAADLRARLAAGGAVPTVIDLRATADGDPDDGVAIARLFVKGGASARPLATLAARNVANAVITAGDTDGALTMPVVLLVSNGTGNAAEILASALADNGRARLVGEPTAGLAGVQKLVRLPEGHGLWLTYGRYLRADGTPIHGRGLRPDVAADIPTVGFGEEPPRADRALERALQELAAPVSAPPAPSAR
jgi:carboxyl-terminal processing protease